MQGPNQGNIPAQYRYSYQGSAYPAAVQPQQHAIPYPTRTQQPYGYPQQQNIVYRPVTATQQQYYGPPQQQLFRSMAPYQTAQRMYDPAQYAQPVQRMPQAQQAMYRQPVTGMPTYAGQSAGAMIYASQPVAQSSASMYIQQRSPSQVRSVYSSQYDANYRPEYRASISPNRKRTQDRRYSRGDNDSEDSVPSYYRDDDPSYRHKEREYREGSHQSCRDTRRSSSYYRKHIYYSGSDERGTKGRKSSYEPLEEEWGGITEGDGDDSYEGQAYHQLITNPRQAVSGRSRGKRRANYEDSGYGNSARSPSKDCSKRGDGVFYIASAVGSSKRRRRNEEYSDRAAKEDRLAKEDAMDNEITSQILRNTRKQLRKVRRTVLEVGTDIMCARLYRDEARHVSSLVRTVWEGKDGR
eukprot:gb/GECG01016809.1/.p1 GENE.gb/GECG01016809.1/~~gb/GECG01016809.1/.p1  ORF type:complete len:410 (+),score=31.35 gb/GECG01016809.1/:1-1230(+)